MPAVATQVSYFATKFQNKKESQSIFVKIKKLSVLPGGPLVAKETEGRLTVVGILRERYKEIKIFCLILFRALPDCGSPLYPCLTAVEVWTAPSCLMTTSVSQTLRITPETGRGWELTAPG